MFYVGEAECIEPRRFGRKKSFKPTYQFFDAHCRRLNYYTRVDDLEPWEWIVDKSIINRILKEWEIEIVDDEAIIAKMELLK